MADIQSVFKPRRGKKSTMTGSKKSTVLQSGEMFIELDDAGAGKGHSRMKIGDGKTTYETLPYAMGDTSNDKIDFTAVTDNTCDSCLNKVQSGTALGTLVAALKQAISCNKTGITKLNDDTKKLQDRCTTLESYDNDLKKRFPDDLVFSWTSDGKPGWKKEGADTVNPFSSDNNVKIYKEGLPEKSSCSISLRSRRPEARKLVYACVETSPMLWGNFKSGHNVSVDYTNMIFTWNVAENCMNDGNMRFTVYALFVYLI